MKVMAPPPGILSLEPPSRAGSSLGRVPLTVDLDAEVDPSPMAFAEMLRRRSQAKGAPPDDESQPSREAAAREPAPSGSNVAPADALRTGMSSKETDGATPARAVEASDLFARMVTSAAIGGDARRGTLRIELGGRERGRLTITASEGDIEIDCALAGVDTQRLEARVARRLAARGLRLVSFSAG